MSLTSFLYEDFLENVYKKINAYKRLSSIQSDLKESLDLVMLDSPDFNLDSILNDAIFRLTALKDDFNAELNKKDAVKQDKAADSE